jgi:hypothetical protein
MRPTEAEMTEEMLVAIHHGPTSTLATLIVILVLIAIFAAAGMSAYLRKRH